LHSSAQRAPTNASVDRRVLDDLVELHEDAGRAEDSLRVRRLRLARHEDARARAHELRAIASMEESLGRREAAIAELDRARALVPDDATLAEQLDRMLEASSLHARRIGQWAQQAARAESGPTRARAFVRAARIAESVGDVERAIEHLRAALVAAPAHAEAIDALARLLAQPPSAEAAAEARARIGVYAHAAEHADDPVRRVAYLELIALLQEELLGEAALAVVTYEAILALEPGRRSAVIGLARAAARAGDRAKLAGALLEESKAARDPPARDDLRVRAAEAIAPVDAERALTLAREVLARDAANAGARALEQRLHEAAERWALVDRALAARIQHAPSARDALDLWLARADLQRVRLRAPDEALASLRAALAIDRASPVVRDAIVSLLVARGDARALRDGLGELAKTAPAPADEVRWLVRAAEIDELVLLDDARAAETYARALALAPDDPWLSERRARVALRRARSGAARDLETALTERRQRAPNDAARAFDLALAIIDGGGDSARATPLVELVLTADAAAPHALRTLERIARATGAAPLLANALARQADAFAAPAPKLGALWALAALVEWRLPENDASAVADGILEYEPGDRAALEARVRYAIPKARTGDAGAHAQLTSALRGLLGQAADETTRLLSHLALALVLDPNEAPSPETSEAREALDHAREALHIDARSLVAAALCARLAAALGDAEAGVAAGIANAELAADPKRRAVFLTHAAGQVLSAEDARFGTRPERLARAGELLERALEADAESAPAVGLLVAVRTEDRGRDRLLASLRAAFDKARSSDAIVSLGHELARGAGAEPPDRVLAVDALRRVLAAAPSHVPTLRALADLYVTQGATGEAVDALESVAKLAREPKLKLGALFELADLYSGALARPADAERVLRAALEVDPSNARALGALVDRRRAAGADADEVASLLTRLGEAETSPDAKGAVLTDLAALKLAAGDRAAAERALVEAMANAPGPALLARLLDLHAGAPTDQARALGAVVERAKATDRPDASTFAMLGQIAVESLGSFAEGIEHLRVAVALAPAMHEARGALAKGLAHTKASAEAVSILMAMIVPDATPLVSLRDPAGALATLEAALGAEGRREEALVARELRAIAGGLDDGAHVELRTRRLPSYDPASAPVVFDRASLRAGLVPPEAQAPLFDVAVALGGIESKIVRTDLEELGILPRERVPHTRGHPLSLQLQRVARMLGIAPPELVVSDQIACTRVAITPDAPWVLAPEALAAHPEPVQAASLARAVARIALGVPWIEELPAVHVHAVLCAAARQVDPELFGDVRDARQMDLVDDYTRSLGRAIGRRQKKALGELASQLASMPTPTVADAEKLALGIARAEVRVAFIVTGDLLSTLDDLRAVDAAFARETGTVGALALGTTLAHPLAGDIARFALYPGATSLRWRAGTLWGVAR
jgi:hypothetical protein